MDIVKALNWRYATKSFDSSKKLSEDQVETLLEALRLSPSSFGLQPWKFIRVKNADLRAKIQASAWNQVQITEASDLLVIASKITLTEDDATAFIADSAKAQGIDPSVLDGYKSMIVGTIGSRSSEALKAWNAKQAYIALGVLMAAAATLEIDACPMEGFDTAAVDSILGLEAMGYTTAVVCPVGYRSATDSYATRTKVRVAKEKVTLTLE